MKRFVLLLMPLLLATIALTSCDVVAQANATTPAQTQPTTFEIGTALKQALEQGSIKSADQLSAVNGFFGNAAIKILFPPQAQKAESTLRKLGMGKLCDDVILSLNRAAEDAAKQAKPIFVNAIKQMTIQDVSNILLGSPDAATQYFKRTTTTDLTSKFKPVIEASLNKVGATKYYATAATTYNKVPFVSKLNPDISDYTTQKAIEGLFVEIATQELKIRESIGGSRTTPVLQKVFSFADKFKKKS